jgi:hypothetical protein
VVFLDNLSRQLVRVDNVHIALQPDSTAHRLSPGEFDLGSFMFGTMLDLTTSPSAHSSATVWRRIPAYLAPDADNRIYDFVAPPREMVHFAFGAAIPRPLLVAARQSIGAATNTGAHLYFFYGYIGNLLYCFEFSPTRTRENIIIAVPIYGRMLGRIEAILLGEAFPPAGVDDWTLLRHEDVPSGKGGGVWCHTSNGGPQPRADGPREARGGASGASSAP